MRTTSFIVAVLCLALQVSFSPAWAAGLPEEGERIARLWCANCHAVADDQSSASTDVPSFRAISRLYEDAPDTLAKFLMDPHPIMPNMSLTQTEIRDLVAYIGSLD